MESVINYIEMLIENQMNIFLKENPICTSKKSREKLYDLTVNNLQTNYNTMTDYQLLRGKIRSDDIFQQSFFLCLSSLN